MSYKSNYTGEQIDKVIGDNIEVSIKDLKSELDDAKDVVVYQMPSDFIPQNGEEVSKEITTDVFQSIFGNIDEFINNVKTKHIRLGIPYLYDDASMTGFIYTDVTSSISVKISPTEEEVIDFINIQGSFSLGEDYTISVVMDIMCNSTDMMGSWTAKKETTPEEVKTELEAKLEEKIKTIIYNWDDLDLSVSEGTVSQEVYDNLLKADVVTNNGAVFNGKIVEGTSIILIYQSSGEGGEGLLGYRFGFVTVKEDLSYTIESFEYNLPSEELVDKKINNAIYSVLNTEV